MSVSTLIFFLTRLYMLQLIATIKPTQGIELKSEINKRFIKSIYLNRSILTAFESLISNNTFPSFFIHLSIDPSLIDINIHPTKTEIKFQDEKSIYSILKSTIKKSLGQYNLAPSIDFNQEIAFTKDLY